MATQVLMPKLGLTMTEGTVEEWKFNEGDAVKKGDILFSVSTDKLTNDIEAEADGTLLKIVTAPGETVPCLAVIGVIGAEGEDIEAALASAGDASQEGSGDGANASAGAGSVEEKAPATADAAQNQASSNAANDAQNAMGAKAAGEGYVPATPYAKKMAKEKGIDLHDIAFSADRGYIIGADVDGYKGMLISPTAAKVADELGIDPASLGIEGRRIMKEDILKAAGQSDACAGAEVTAAPGTNDLPPVKVDPLRRSIAKNMKASWEISPRVTYTRPVDATGMKELRARLKGNLAEQGIKLTYNHILIKVCAKALMEFPDINASFADDMLTRHVHANIGLAVAKGDGLIVPNIKCADEKSLKEIASETEEMIEKTREGKIDMSDMTGGTFTISNIGVYGITSFSPIINQPELAILGVCDMVDTPVVIDGEIRIRPMMNLSLTADHRVIDGVMAAKFLKRITELLENPYMLLV